MGIPSHQGQMKGGPLSLVDGRLAASALQYSLTIASGNVSDLRRCRIPVVNLGTFEFSGRQKLAERSTQPSGQRKLRVQLKSITMRVRLAPVNQLLGIVSNRLDRRQILCYQSTVNFPNCHILLRCEKRCPRSTTAAPR